MVHKISLIVLIVFVMTLGFYLGKESAPPQGNEEMALDIVYPEKRMVSYEVKDVAFSMPKVDRGEILSKIKVKKRNDLVRLVKLQPHFGYPNDSGEEAKKIQELIDNDPVGYFKSLEEILMEENKFSLNLREKQVLVQMGMAVSVNEQMKLSLLGNVMKGKLQKNRNGRPTEKAYLKMTATREMINHFPFEEIERTIFDHLQNQDPELAKAFIIAPILEKYPNKRYLFDDFYRNK